MSHWNLLDASGKEIPVAELIKNPDSFLKVWNPAGLSVASENRISQALAAIWALESDAPVLVPEPGQSLNSKQVFELQTITRECSEGGAIWFRSSGSSGVPKFVLHSTHALIRASENLLSAAPNLAGGRYIHFFPTYYMAGLLNNMIFPWVSGAEILLAPTFNFSSPRSLHKLLSPTLQNNVWLSPNMLAGILAGSTKETVSRFSNIICATGATSKSIFARFGEAGMPDLYNSYGSTEQLFLTLTSGSGSWEGVGYPLPGVSVNVNERGCLMVHGPFEPLAMLAGDSLDRMSWSSPFETQDVGMVAEDGSVELIGRADDWVSIGGIQKNLRAYELAAQEVEGVITACVSYSATNSFRDLKLLVEFDGASEGEETARDAIAHQLRKVFPSNEIPGSIEFSEIPRLANGKVDRLRLRNF